MPSSNGLIFKRIIAIALFTILIHWSVAESQESILDSQFTFRTGSIKTGNALNIISRQTGFNFTYDSELINPEVRIFLDQIEVHWLAKPFSIPELARAIREVRRSW